ncbi:phytanoyl-CoA dioxygenase family protein [Streptomyces nogalater]|uniref:Phytanoyl-CoA dioxygenase family protein n=3 Tax=Streptomyces nogalater TaxID=38314 RepID=A0A167XFI0_STRNO|nr:SnoN [Streptomyces nogalater]
MQETEPGVPADLPAESDPAALERLAARYRRDGYVHVPGVLDAGEVAEYLAEARRLLAHEESVRWGSGAGTVMDYVADAQLGSDTMRRLATHPRIAALAEYLAGSPLRLFKLEVLLKENKEKDASVPTAPHHDAFAFPFSTAGTALTAWVALVDVPVERGCMTFVPGSHLLPDPDTGDEPWAGAFTRPGEIWMPRVTVPLRAGDCTFHHARTVHSAGANSTDEPRLSTSAVYMDATAAYRPTGIAFLDDLPGTGADPLREGAPLTGDRFPLLRRPQTRQPAPARYPLPQQGHGS